MSKRINRENLQLVDDLLKETQAEGQNQATQAGLVKTARIILARELDAPTRKYVKKADTGGKVDPRGGMVGPKTE